MAETNIDKVGKDDWVPATEAYERGYSGYTPDDTPNEDYTVAGVTKSADKPAGGDAERRVAPKGK